MKLIIAGGCGEHGRNCFHVEGAYTNFLVDCGILAGEPGGGYPHLSADETRQLKCVFLTHSHADHTGALPWLRQLGYTGPVVASRYTLEQLPFYLEAGIALEELCPHGEGMLCGIGAAAGIALEASGIGFLWKEKPFCFPEITQKLRRYG